MECAPVRLIVDEPPMPNTATMLVLNEMCSINGLGAGAQTLIRPRRNLFLPFNAGSILMIRFGDETVTILSKFWGPPWESNP